MYTMNSSTNNTLDFHLVHEYFNEKTTRRRKIEISELIDEIKREVGRKQQSISNLISSTKKQRQILIFRELPPVKQSIERFFSFWTIKDPTHYHEYYGVLVPYSVLSKSDVEFIMND